MDRKTTHQAKEMIMSALTEIVSDEQKNCEDSTNPDCNETLIEALKIQIERVRLALFYK